MDFGYLFIITGSVAACLLGIRRGIRRTNFKAGEQSGSISIEHGAVAASNWTSSASLLLLSRFLSRHWDPIPGFGGLLRQIAELTIQDSRASEQASKQAHSR
jgi:hypothetical protein